MSRLKEIRKHANGNNMKYFYTVSMVIILTICVYVFVDDDFVFGLPAYIYTLLPYGEWFLLLLMGSYFILFLTLIIFMVEKRYNYIFVILICLLFFTLNAIAAQYVNIGVSVFDIDFSSLRG